MVTENKFPEKNPRGRPAKRTAEEMIAIATNIFWAQGYEGTSISDLTQKIGIERPSLYAKFGSKENLFKVCAEHYLRNKVHHIDAAMKEPFIHAALEQLFQYEVAHTTSQKGCLMINAALSCRPEHQTVKALLIEHRKNIEGKFRRRIQRAQLNNEVGTSESPNTIAKYLASIYQGLAIQAVDGASNKELQEVVKIALKAIALR